MEDIKVGEYCRTKEGNIFRAEQELKTEHNIPDKYKKLIDKNPIVKHSFELINLIEEGDFVNGSMVFETGKAINRDKWVHTYSGQILYENEIKTILTHEQYEQNCYKVEE